MVDVFVFVFNFMWEFNFYFDWIEWVSVEVYVSLFGYVLFGVLVV